MIAAVPKELENAKFKPVESGKEAVRGLKNATLSVEPLMTIVPANTDLVWTSMNYHDLHTKNFPGLDAVAFEDNYIQERGLDPKVTVHAVAFIDDTIDQPERGPTIVTISRRIIKTK